MKKILITGKNSYVGTSFEEWVADEPGKYQVYSISLRDEAWKHHDFSQYDTVLHVAGIAHRKETKKNRDLYYEVNRDLAIETAIKAKEDGVKQFIFLSTMSVYGMETGVITTETKPNPKNAYGQSKLEAEKSINRLNSASFRVSILRPPMIYGKNCKGNYQRLAKFANMFPLFPNIKNNRSMIYIDNLSEFIKNIIATNQFGLFFPQNEKYIETTELVSLIAQINNKKIILTKVFNPIIKLFSFYPIIKKVFGNLIYEKKMSKQEFEYQIYNLSESIKIMEK